ncbi:MAG: 5-oxoprolinase subunit B family protein [Jatrophihabitantaceae bacterium]
MLRPYGERAVLAEVADSAAALALRAAMTGLDGVVELVPGARTLLVSFDPSRTYRRRISAALSAAEAAPRRPEPVPGVQIAVSYDGADLDAVVAATGLSRAEVVRRHVAAQYTVAFCGFAPGFAYLRGLDPALHVARLDEPRTAVPAGGVAIAGEFSAVYPRPSPGGWRLIGHTDAVLWDLGRTPPAVLAPGTPVRFRPT